MADIDGQEEMFAGANVSKIEDGDILASLSAWARIFGTERETLRRRLLDANVTSKAKRQGHPVYGGRDVVSAWLCGPEARIDPEALTPFQRRAWYQGEHEKLKLEVERGQLVPDIEVEQTLGKLAKAFVHGLDTLVDTVERDVGLSAAQARKLESHLDRVRENIFLAIGGDPEPAGTASAADRSAVKPKTGTVLDAAVGFLQRQLKRGPKPAPEIMAAAKKAGISESAVRRAKAKLGKTIVAKREGRGSVWMLAGRKTKRRTKTRRKTPKKRKR